MFSPIVLGSGLTGYNFLTRTRADQQDALAKSPEVARDTAAFRDRLAGIQTAEQLLDDRASLRVALGAFGLDDDLNNRAFLKQILESDLTDDRSLANRLADKRYLAFAQAFNFASDDGPSLGTASSADEVAEKLAGIATVDDLFKDRTLLRAALESFGLERDINNTFFLRKVLESNLEDPDSFANSLTDPRYADLSETFGLGEKLATRDSIYGFAALFADRAAEITTSDDLLNAPDLLDATLRIFQLEPLADDPDLLRAVLDSDLSDPASIANQQDDRLLAALAGAFDFAARAEAIANDQEFTSTLEKFVNVVTAREVEAETPKALLDDIQLSLATFEFFDLPVGADSFPFASRILNSDRDNPTSLVNVFPDARYRAFADAFTFKQDTGLREYPPGLADGVISRYMDRQFEIAVGEVDTDMRIALSFGRELTQVIGTATSNDSRWFSIMGSKPLRAVFETVFSLPSSFGQLDIDKQLEIFKDKARSVFDTENALDFLEPELMEKTTRRYLLQASVQQGAALSSGGSIVATLLAGAVGQP